MAKFREWFPCELRILLTFSALLLAAWSLIVPIFEAPDESAHWDYARYIHYNWRLPPYSPAFVEGNQPPLYYLLIAPVAARTSSPKAAVWFDGEGRMRYTCPPRIYQDCLSDFRKFWLVRIARFATVAFSLCTVLFAYLAGREATGRPYAGLVAGSLTAFLPQFTFRGTNISNDAMVAATCAILTYLIVRLIRRGFSWKLACVASVFVALAFLSKISGIIFAPIFIATLLAQQCVWATRLKAVGVSLLAIALCAGPWMMRNQVLYGDPVAGKAMLAVVPMLVHQKSISSPYFTRVFPGTLAKSFVGVFGGMTVYLPEWLYTLCGALALLGIIGFFYSFAQGRLGVVLPLVLISLPILAIASTIQLNLTFDQPQGRYLFPALVPFMVCLAIGLTSISRWKVKVTYGTVALCLAINLYALLAVELPSYWSSKQPTETVVDTEVPSNLMLGGPAGPLRPGSRFGQTFVAGAPNLSEVQIEIATYSKRIPAGFVKLHLRHSVEDPHDIATVSIPAANITDNSFLTLSFPPIGDSRGKSFYMFLDVEGVPSKFALTVYKSGTDVYPGGQFFVDNKATTSDTCFRTLATVGGTACDACGESARPAKVY